MITNPSKPFLARSLFFQVSAQTLILGSVCALLTGARADVENCHQSVRISEIMAANESGLKDAYGDNADWNLRNYRAPYVGDHGRNISVELFGKTDVQMSFARMNHAVCHLAFTTGDPEKWAQRMVYGGARQVGSARTEANGDVVVDLFDPSHFPVCLIKRSRPVLAP